MLVNLQFVELYSNLRWDDKIASNLYQNINADHWGWHFIYDWLREQNFHFDQISIMKQLLWIFGILLSPSLPSFNLCLSCRFFFHIWYYFSVFILDIRAVIIHHNQVCCSTDELGANTSDTTRLLVRRDSLKQMPNNTKNIKVISKATLEGRLLQYEEKQGSDLSSWKWQKTN